jgi:hypothetical protein
MDEIKTFLPPLHKTKHISFHLTHREIDFLKIFFTLRFFTLPIYMSDFYDMGENIPHSNMFYFTTTIQAK